MTPRRKVSGEGTPSRYPQNQTVSREIMECSPDRLTVDAILLCKLGFGRHTLARFEVALFNTQTQILRKLLMSGPGFVVWLGVCHVISRQYPAS
jgi:hypothetical protein